MIAAHTPIDVKSGPNRKIQCGRNSASSSSSSLRNFRGKAIAPAYRRSPAGPGTMRPVGTAP